MNLCGSIRGYVPLIAVILVFTVSLAFSIHGVLKQENATQAAAGSALHLATQLEIEHLRFRDTFDHFALADSATDKRDVVRQFDILRRRTPPLLTSAEGLRFGKIDDAHRAVEAFRRSLRQLEPKIMAFSPDQTAAYSAIRDQLDAMTQSAQKLVYAAFRADDELASLRKKDLRQVYFMLAGSLAGVLMSGGILVVLLIRQVRKAGDAGRAATDALQQAEQANRSKSEFLANMSHELRTPLNAIIGFSEVMKDGTFGPVENRRYKEYVDDIYASGTHLLAIVGDILDTAKIEAGKIELEEEELSLAETVDAAVRIVKSRAAEAGLVLSVRIPSGLPNIYADKRFLKQMILNLLTNAIKFTPRGGRVTIEARLESDGGVTLEVRDTGLGMASEDIPEALSPFGQVGSAVSRTHGGTGLGLPLVKSLAELHGGLLTLHSVVAEGTSAEIYLPATRIVRSEAVA